MRRTAAVLPVLGGSAWREFPVRVIDVQTDNGVVRMAFPTDGLSPEQVDDSVTWLRVEGIARRSRLTEPVAWQLSEDLKAAWWEQNQARFGG